MGTRVRVLQISKAEIRFLDFREKLIKYINIRTLNGEKHGKMLKQEDTLKGLRF